MPSRMKFNSKRSFNYSGIVNSIWYGTPNETESDRCLMKIVRSSLCGECRIPKLCIQMLNRDDDSMGYPLTHRLLIIQVAQAVSKIIRKYLY